MTDPVEALILDLLDWLMVHDRTYEEVMDAWRTSCPRLPVWEDANDRGLIVQQEVNGKSLVRVSSSGRALLGQRKSQRTKLGGSSQEPQQRPRDTLDELLAHCNRKAPHSQEEREWLADKPAGGELI
jgi:hypothetical protein